MSDFQSYRQGILLPDQAAFPAEPAPGDFLIGRLAIVLGILYVWDTGRTNHGGAQQFWQEVFGSGQIVPGATGMDVSFTDGNSPDVQTSSAVYKPVGRVEFEGSTLVGTPTMVKAIAWRGAGAGTVDVRLYDVTNAQVVAELTGISDTIPTIQNLGALANIPAAPAIFELQMRRVGAGTTANASSMRIGF